MLNELNKMLPIIDGSIIIEKLSNEHKDWYLKNLKDEYFSKFLDAKYDSKNELKVNLYIQSIIDLPLSKTNEIRTVVIIDGKLVGGITLHKMDKGIEIAYFINPAHQRKGYAYRALNIILQKIKVNDYSDIYAIVQICNEASIKLLQKLNFKEVERVQGAVCTNIWFKLKLAKIKLKKCTNIKMLQYGKVRTVNCILGEMMYNRIPLYTDENCNNIQVIRFDTNEILVLMNRNKYLTFKKHDKENEYRLLTIYILYSILTERYKTKSKADICLAYWFGFTQIIDFIRNNTLGKYSQQRVKVLEHELLTNELSLTIPSIQDFLNSIDFVDVI